MSQPFDNRDYDVQQLAAKDAEIKRLKHELEEMTEAALSTNYFGLLEVNRRLRSLVTELADALETSASLDTDWARQSNHLEVVLRARKATK